MYHALFVTLFNPLDHLLRNEAAGLQVEFALALDKQIFEGWAEHVHHHDVELVLFVGLVRPDIIQLRHVSFASQLVNHFRLPEKHDVLLVFYCSLDFRRVHVAVFFLLNFINFAEGTVA